MTTQIDHRIIEAAMQQGRLERALAFKRMARAAYRGIRDTAKMVVAIFA